MAELKDNKRKKKTDKENSLKEKFKETAPDVVLVKEDDLRELVTETVTKLMAEDVLDMDENGTIDLKEEVEFKKKKRKNTQKQKQTKDDSKKQD